MDNQAFQDGYMQKDAFKGMALRAAGRLGSKALKGLKNTGTGFSTRRNLHKNWLHRGAVSHLQHSKGLDLSPKELRGLVDVNKQRAATAAGRARASVQTNPGRSYRAGKGLADLWSASNMSVPLSSAFGYLLKRFGVEPADAVLEGISRTPTPKPQTHEIDTARKAMGR